MTCEGAQASQGHPKEPCRDPRPSREGWEKGEGNGTPSPSLPPLYVPNSSLAIVSGRAQRDPPKTTKIWKKKFTFLLFLFLLQHFLPGFFFPLSSLEKFLLTMK